MDTQQDQTKIAEQSRSSAFHSENADLTFATAFLQPPPLQLIADPRHTIDKAKEAEEVSAPETVEKNEVVQQNTIDPISSSQAMKVEPEADEIKEPFSLELDFASGPNENPTDASGEDNHPSGGEDGPSGGDENTDIIQQMPFDIGASQNLSENANPSQENFTPDIQNFDESQAIPSNDIMSQMESAFGQSFSEVQIHENSEKASSMGARAFAQGNNVHFAPGEYNPNSEEGRSLLGHELTHVVQQRQGRVQETNQMQGFSLNNDSSLEREADEMGAKAASGDMLPFNLNAISENGSQIVQRKVVQFELEEEELNEVVQGLRDIQHQSNAVRLLRENHSELEAIKPAFQESTSGEHTLRQFIQRFYNEWDYKVRATALLFDSSYDHDWTSIALALIPPQTRDGEFFRIMGNLSRSQKRELRRRYNARFLMLGEGSLDADIRSDFDGVDELKAWIISYRDLTDADNIYLKTQHITSSNASEIVTTLRRLWGYGLNSFERKLEQWNPSNNLPDVIPSSSGFGYYFQNSGENFASKWVLIDALAKSLMLTVLHESYSASAEQIFLEYINQKGQGVASEASPVVGWAFTEEEESNLNIARTRLTSAENWYDDNESEIDAASEEIVAIYRGRIERLRLAGASAEMIGHAEGALAAVQDRLVTNHDASVSSITVQNLADQLYALRRDQTNYTDKILEIFKQGQLETLKEEARTASTFNNEEIRPAFDISGPLHMTDMRGGRMHSFLSKRSDDQAGSYWIKDTIDREYVLAATLNYLHSFINAGPWSGGILDSIISYFNSRNVNSTFLSLYDGDQKRILIRHLTHIGFDEFSSWRTFRDALVPAESDSELAARAQVDMEQERSLAVSISDVFTGEDTAEVAETSLRRLQRFAHDSGADDEEMRVFRSFYAGELNLVSREYEMFQARLGDMRSAKNQVASLANTVVSTIIEAALSPFITPAGGAVVGQVCGILTEWLINPEYEPVSTDNLGNIVLAAATAGAASWTDEAGSITRWVNNRTGNQFLRVAARESIEQSITTSASAFCAALQGRLDENWIRSHIEEALASRIAEGLVSRMDIDRIQSEVTRNAFRGMAETVVQEMITTSGSIVLGEGENEEALANRIAQSVLTSLLSSTIEGIAEGHRTRRQDDETTSRMMDDADAIEEAGIAPAPDLNRDGDGDRTAIVPPAPTEERRVPAEPHVDSDEPTDSSDDRPTLNDIPTTDTIPSPEHHDPPDHSQSETIPAPPAVVTSETIVVGSDRDTIPEDGTGDTIPVEDRRDTIPHDGTGATIPAESEIDLVNPTFPPPARIPREFETPGPGEIDHPDSDSESSSPDGPEEQPLQAPSSSSPTDHEDEITTVFDDTTSVDDNTEVDLNLPENAAGGMLQSDNDDERHDQHFNENMFDEIAEMHPTHECALAYNPNTGEYAVVHGEQRQVTPPPGFVFLAHSHPVSETGHVTFLDQNPSVEDLIAIANGDHHYAVSDHYIRVRTEYGVERVQIRFQADGSFLIDVTDRGGVMERGRRFRNIRSYHQWLNANHYD